MGSFIVLITKNAEDDLEEIRNYISKTLKENDTADEYMNIIRKAMQSLDDMPLRYNVIDSEPFNSMQLRRMIVKNFYVYYSVDKANNAVSIHGVIYSRRNQYAALGE